MVPLAVLFFCGVFTVNEVDSITILMTAVDQRGRMSIMNDSNVPVAVDGPGMRLTDVPEGQKMNLFFQGPGKVTIRENGSVIFDTNLGRGRFNAVRTHSDAFLTEVLGDIIINQKPGRLNLVMNGSSRKHTLALTEGEFTTKQSVSLSGNNIAISQSSKLNNQNLAFTGSFQSISWTQDGTPDNQNVAIHGRGRHAVSMHKSNGFTLVTQVF